MKNEKGFVLTLFIALLPVILAAMTCIFVLIGLLEDRFSRQNACRRQLLSALEKAGTAMQELMELNPMASGLRAQIMATTAVFVSATASGNIPVATAAARQLKVLKTRQKLLDVRQKSLLVRAQADLSMGQMQARASLWKSPQSFIKVSAPFPRPVRPALRPDAPGPGPVYVLKNPFEEKQMLEQKWQSQFELRGALANFLNARGRFEEKCAATLIPQGKKWRARLAEDKSFLKR